MIFCAPFAQHLRKKRMRKGGNYSNSFKFSPFFCSERMLSIRSFLCCVVFFTSPFLQKFEFIHTKYVRTGQWQGQTLLMDLIHVALSHHDALFFLCAIFGNTVEETPLSLVHNCYGISFLVGYNIMCTAGHIILGVVWFVCHHPPSTI